MRKLKFSFFNSQDTTTNLRETTNPMHVEVVTKNYTTAESTDEKTNQTLKYNDSVNFDGIISILAGVLIPIAIFCMLCVICRKGKIIYFDFFILLNLIRICKEDFSTKMVILIAIDINLSI